jgi:hypothetical protein
VKKIVTFALFVGFFGTQLLTPAPTVPHRGANDVILTLQDGPGGPTCNPLTQTCSGNGN